MKTAIDANVPLAHLESLVDDLQHHNESTFDDAFREEMKKEIPKLLRIVEEYAFHFELDAANSSLYENREKSRKRRKRNNLAMEVLRENELGVNVEDNVHANSTAELLQAYDVNREENNVSMLDWKVDAGERGRRVSEWWANVMVESNEEWLPCFEKMFVLLCLLRQPSSAIVERAFSQVNYIRSLCGDNLKEDNLELRAMLRCNDEDSQSFEY